MDKKKFVANIHAGETIQDVFVLAEKNRAYKRDGNPFLNVVLADRTGQIKGVVWDNVEQAAAAEGDFVRISATAGEYRGALQLVVKSLQSVGLESINSADYLPVTTRDVEQMLVRLKSLTETFTCPWLRRLMAGFWEDEEFVRRFKRAPAAKKMHHAYIGGLLEHTLSMALLGEKIAGHYSGVDRDLLITGAVLHDIGKLGELIYDYRIDYSDEGRLLSHIVIGLEMVEAKIRTIDQFPPERAMLVKHLLVSHHGTREFGSPEPPKTIEAVLLNSIDEMDAHLAAIREFMADEDSNGAWTAYHRLLERHFYRGQTARGTDTPTAGQER